MSHAPSGNGTAGNPASGKVLEKSGMQRVGSEHRQLEPERISGEYVLYEMRKPQGHGGKAE